MRITASNVNRFLLFKLPSAFFTGVRVESLSENACVTRVKFRWFNQNPFGSMFWAVQGMAAELSTGALLLSEVERSSQNISTLIMEAHGSFMKKAKGRIKFSCVQSEPIREAVQDVINSNQPKAIWLTSIGKDEEGDIVAQFEFLWTLKMRKG